MIRRTPSPLTLGVALVVLGACDSHDHHDVCSPVVGSGNLATESRPVQGFTAVELSGAGHLIVEQTGVESLRITAEDNVLPLVRSKIRNGRLELGFEPGASVTATHEVLYRLSVRELSGVEASAASRVEIRGVETAELALRLVGASTVSATGVVGRVELALVGASLCDAPELQSRVLRANLSGASLALVRVSDSLEVSASGASILEYLGNPSLTTNVSGGSLVRRAGP